MSIFVGKRGLYRDPIKGKRRGAYMAYPRNLKGAAGRSFGKTSGSWIPMKPSAFFRKRGM